MHRLPVVCRLVVRASFLRLAHQLTRLRWIFGALLAPLLLYSGFALAVDITMLRKVAGTWLFGPVPVYTDDATSSPIFFPMSDPIPFSSVRYASVGYQMTGDTGSCKIRAGARFTDDGVNWSPAAYIDVDFADDNNEIVWSGHVDLTGLGEASRSLIQFGALAEAESAAFAFCQATVRVEPHPN